MVLVLGNLMSKEVVVAIPALGERKEMFIPLAQSLKQYKWLILDLPGTNQEELNDYSIALFCQKIERVLAEHTIEQAHFIGSSIGAWIIQAYAAYKPSAIRSLALLDGGHYFLGEQSSTYEEVVLPSMIKDFEDIEVAVQELTDSMPDLEEFCYENFEQYFLGNYIEVDGYYKHHCQNVAYNQLSKEVEEKNYCLAELHKPIIVLLAGATMGDESRRRATAFQQQHPQAIVQIIRNGQHYLPLTNTREVAKPLHDFLVSASQVKV